METKCGLAHCYNGHAFLTLGDIPGVDTVTYAETRNRLEGTDNEWLRPEMKAAMSCKLYETNYDGEVFTSYNKERKSGISGLLSCYKKTNIIWKMRSRM